MRWAAGFERASEVHGANGYLIEQFLLAVAYTNLRHRQ